MKKEELVDPGRDSSVVGFYLVDLVGGAPSVVVAGIVAIAVVVPALALVVETTADDVETEVMCWGEPRFPPRSEARFGTHDPWKGVMVGGCFPWLVKILDGLVSLGHLDHGLVVSVLVLTEETTFSNQTLTARVVLPVGRWTEALAQTLVVPGAEDPGATVAADFLDTDGFASDSFASATNLVDSDSVVSDLDLVGSDSDVSEIDLVDSGSVVSEMGLVVSAMGLVDSDSDSAACEMEVVYFGR